MNPVSENSRLSQIPVLYVRGTHFEVGYTIGRQFKSMIDNLLTNWKFFNETVLQAYLTADGKQIYENTLRLCTQKFPHYINEIQGMAQGAKVPFFKLFLCHIESVIVPQEEANVRGNTGCTSVMCNTEEVIIGHTEDAFPEFLNNVYIVSAEVVDSKGTQLEKFTTLTYAGHLPGYTMGFNCHGMVYSVNTLFPKQTRPENTPRTFLARAILSASNFEDTLNILRDSGTGVSDGFSLNIHFANQEGSPVMHNVEIFPPNKENEKQESDISVLNLTHGDTHVHCNKYLRLPVEEIPGVGVESSNRRHKAIGRHLKPTCSEKIKLILSDQSDLDFPVFRTGRNVKHDFIKTVLAGVLDVAKREWIIYAEPPSTSLPVAILKIDF